MPPEPWDNPDLDDYEFLQGRMEGVGDWADSHADRYEELNGDQLPMPRSFGRREVAPEISSPLRKVKRFRIIQVLKGDEYILSEKGWSLQSRPYTFVPIMERLNNKLRMRLVAEDADIEDPAQLVERAWFGQALGHFDRVADLAERAIRAVIQPPDKYAGGAIVPRYWRSEALGAAAMLSSALRELGESERALSETEIFADEQCPPLMTSRAAAMCDTDRWDGAYELAVNAQHLEDSDEVRNLMERIKRHFASPSEYAAG